MATGGKGPKRNEDGSRFDSHRSVVEDTKKSQEKQGQARHRNWRGGKKKKPSDRGRRGPHVKNRNQERRECKQYLSNRTQWENLKKVPLAKKTAMLSLGTRKMIRTLWRWKQQVSTIRKWCLGEKKKRKKEREEGWEGRKECRNLLAVCSLRQQQTARTKTPWQSLYAYLILRDETRRCDELHSAFA